MRFRPRGVIYLVLILVVVGVIYAFSKSTTDLGAQAEERSYAQLVQGAEAGDVLSSTLTSGGTVIDWSDSSGLQYRTNIDPQVTRIDPDLAVKMHLSVTPQSNGSLLLSLLPNIVFLALLGSFMFAMLRSRRRAGANGQSVQPPGPSDIVG